MNGRIVILVNDGFGFVMFVCVFVWSVFLLLLLLLFVFVFLANCSLSENTENGKLAEQELIRPPLNNCRVFYLQNRRF